MKYLKWASKGAWGGAGTGGGEGISSERMLWELEARQKDPALSGLASVWRSRIPGKLCAVLLWSAALPQHH